MNRFVDKALAMREEIRQGKDRTTDGVPFIVYRDRARLMDVSMSMHPGTKEPCKLLKNDRSIVTQVVRSGGPDQQKRQARQDALERHHVPDTHTAMPPCDPSIFDPIELATDAA